MNFCILHEFVVALQMRTYKSAKYLWWIFYGQTVKDSKSLTIFAKKLHNRTLAEFEICF